jgi:hypothetical protein
VEHEIVVSAGHGERVELDRAEPAEDLEHRIGPAFERPGGREQVVCDEETAGGLGGDLHGGDAIRTRRRAASKNPQTVRWKLRARPGRRALH